MRHALRIPRIIVLGVSAASVFAACNRNTTTAVTIDTAPVERRSITLSAQANGAIEPINVVDIKSKASGIIIKMPVDIGSMVKVGDLLVQIDTRDVQNEYDQAAAALNSAKVSETVASANLKRSKDLYAQRIITAQEMEAATLTYAQAQSGTVAARTNLDLAKQRLEDATVRAPIAGTVITKTVSLGTVITSATSGPSGGTTILQMADLTKVRMRAMVNETDIGNVHPGQIANVAVDAYPSRQFVGTVEKIEPQAVIQQSVTMFSVLISLSNEDAALMPGMNGQATMIIAQRDNVLAIPNDAIRSTRELTTVAPLLGLNPDSVKAALQRGRSAAGGGAAGGGAAGGGAAGGGAAGGGAASGARGARGPNAGGGASGAATTFAPGDTSRAARRAKFQALLGGDTTRAGRMKAMAKMGLDTSAAAMAARRAGGGGGFGGGAGGAGGGSGTAGGSGALAGTGTRALVFMKDSTGKWVPKMVRTGVSDFDYTEILSGLKEGDKVALLASAAMQAQRQQQVQRARAATGGGLQQTTTPTTGGGGGGGGGGGRPPGG